MPRFELIEGSKEFPNDGETCWWWDTERPLQKDWVERPFVAVQTIIGKDPNQFVRITGMHLLFTDDAEYYAVCEACHDTFFYRQNSGFTRDRGWERKSERYLESHERTKGWCEFCDPIFGNGGWSQ